MGFVSVVIRGHSTIDWSFKILFYVNSADIIVSVLEIFIKMLVYSFGPNSLRIRIFINSAVIIVQTILPNIGHFGLEDKIVIAQPSLP